VNRRAAAPVLLSRGPPGALVPALEGDPRLSVILSKAFLLTADTKIADPSILSQIRR
jgi:hypothetical protein